MKKKFGGKAQAILAPEKKIGGLQDFLSDDEPQKPLAGEGDKKEKRSVNTELRKPDKPKEIIEEPKDQPQVVIRHELHLDENLSEKIRAFQFFNKEKNKTRLIKIILNDFFNKTDDQQKKLYEKWLKKYS